MALRGDGVYQLSGRTRGVCMGAIPSCRAEGLDGSASPAWSPCGVPVLPW